MMHKLTTWARGSRLKLRLALGLTAACSLTLLVCVGLMYFQARDRLYAELDRQLEIQYEVFEYHLQPDSDGWRWVQSERADPRDNPTGFGLWLQVWGRGGKLLLEMRPEEHLRLDGGWGPVAGADRWRTVWTRQPRVPFRAMERTVTVRGETVGIRVMTAEAEVRAHIRRLGLAALAVLAIGIWLAGVTGYWIGRLVMKPVDAMIREAERIGARDLGARLPVESREDELGRLATVFNDVLDRLAGAFEELRRFTGDASHELRTPLACLRSRAETCLRVGAGEAEYRSAMEDMIEEIDQISRLVESLLQLARAEGARGAHPMAPVRLRDLLAEVAELLGPLAEEKAQWLDIDVGWDGELMTSRVLLRQALVSLVNNAIQNTPNGGQIRIEGTAGDGAVCIDVIDNGPGIAPEHRQDVFRRFFRIDRPGQAVGFGLGLSIVEASIRALGGTITLDGEPDGGCRFRLQLPSAAPGRSP